MERLLAMLFAMVIAGGLLGACTESQSTTSAGAAAGGFAMPYPNQLKDETVTAIPPASPAPSGSPTPAAGAPVPGKPGVKLSPYDDPRYLDVASPPPGTEVRDPKTGKSYLIP